MNLCICAPNKFRYSETFIHNQIQVLSPTILLYEGWYPSVQPNEKSFLPFPLNILAVRGGLRRFLPKIYHSIYSYFFAKLLKKNKIDVLLANYGPMGASLADACEQAGVKLVTHFHGFDAYHFDTLNKFEKGYQKLFQKATKLVVVSEDMQAQLLRLGADPNKVICNPYWVELERFGGATPENQAPVFIFVGRFTAKKAPQLTLRAFAEAQKQVPDAQLTMVGDGELWEETKLLSKGLGISERVDFLGVKSSDEIAQLLKNSMAFVQHSLRPDNGDSEGTPNTILEASATGLPIISTRHAGIKDAVVHKKTGFLVEEGDWQGMAQYMIQLAKDPMLAGKMGRAARHHMEENYSKKKRVERLSQLLKNA